MNNFDKLLLEANLKLYYVDTDDKEVYIVDKAFVQVTSGWKKSSHKQETDGSITLNMNNGQSPDGNGAKALEKIFTDKAVKVVVKPESVGYAVNIKSQKRGYTVGSY